jgi:hypothetical protein
MHDSHRRRLAAVAAACVLAGLPPSLLAQRGARPQPAAKAAPVATVRAVSRTPLPRGERISIEFSDEVSYLSDRVPGPDRVYFDFKNAIVSSPVVANTQALGAGTLVASVRIARHSEQTTRLVLALTGHPRYSVFSLYNPFRRRRHWCLRRHRVQKPRSPPPGRRPSCRPRPKTPRRSLTPRCRSRRPSRLRNPRHWRHLPRLRRPRWHRHRRLPIARPPIPRPS